MNKPGWPDIRRRFLLLAVAVIILALLPIGSSYVFLRPLQRHALPKSATRLSRRSGVVGGGDGPISTRTPETVERLLKAANMTKFGGDREGPAARRIPTFIAELEEAFADGDADGDNDSVDPSRFEPLLGLYEVTHVQTAKAGENPVGGKWTRRNGFAQTLFRTRRTFQHLLPANSTGQQLPPPHDGEGFGDAVVAEAVNVVSLEALWGLLRLTVILRGDAVPLTAEERHRAVASLNSEAAERVGRLSDLAVRAFFDPPRIVFGKRGRLVNVDVGPTSSVVLDSTYVDDRVRLGKGGTSGTRFVFRRCGENDAEAIEWRWLLERRPAKRINVLSVLGGCLGAGLYAAVVRKARLVGWTVSAVAALAGTVVAFSSGGIERDGASP